MKPPLMLFRRTLPRICFGALSSPFKVRDTASADYVHYILQYILELNLAATHFLVWWKELIYWFRKIFGGVSELFAQIMQ